MVSNDLFKKQIPLFLAFVIGVYMLLEYFFVVPKGLMNLGRDLQNTAIIIVAISIGVGAISALSYHIHRIQRRDSGLWHYSVVMIITFLLFLAVGLGTPRGSPSWNLLYNSFIMPAKSTGYSSWVFFMITGLYRAFRIRNKAGAVLLISGAFIMIGNVPIGELIWDGFPLIRNWIMTVPNMAAQRGILMAAAIGVTTLGIRVLLGKEKSYLGRFE